jgi:hypothetical protein
MFSDLPLDTAFLCCVAQDIEIVHCSALMKLHISDITLFFDYDLSDFMSLAHIAFRLYDFTFTEGNYVSDAKAWHWGLYVPSCVS